MINKYLIFLSSFLSLIVVSVLFPEGVIGLFICLALASITIHVIRSNTKDLDEQGFLINVFIGALLIRALLAIVIYGFELQSAFGPDAFTYDDWGASLANYWWGQSSEFIIDTNRSGWGMPYIVGAIYFVSERNPLAGQLIVSFLGAASSLLAYLISKEIFHNKRVARYTAIFIAFFPAMVVWTCQLLKDGFIIFFLVLALLSAIYLQKKFNYMWVFSLLISLLVISSLRFYIFFILIAAIGGGFVLSSKTSAHNLMTRFVLCLVIGVSFTYLGVWKLSEQQATTFVNLERLQDTRKWANQGANSSLNKDEDVDVSTTGGLIAALPIGMLNLYLAPFPWQVASMTQVMTMPEMVLWWCSLPFLFIGVAYSLRHRLRESVAVLFFTLILSLSYAVYQGNLGTLYRQRAQIQVFLLIFIAAGVTLYVEKRENKKMMDRSQRLK